MLELLDPVGLLLDVEVCSCHHSEMAEQPLLFKESECHIHILPQEDHKQIDTYESRIKIWSCTAHGHRKVQLFCKVVRRHASEDSTKFTHTGFPGGRF